MTNFIKQDGQQKGEPTVFTKSVNYDLEILGEETVQPKYWKNVKHIGYSIEYELDVFKAWDSDESKFFICFGKAGYEFNY